MSYLVESSIVGNVQIDSVVFSVPLHAAYKDQM